MITKENWRRDIARLFVLFPLHWLIINVPLFKKEFSLIRLLGKVHYYLASSKRRMLRDIFNRALQPKSNKNNFDRKIKEYLENHYVNSMLIMLTPKFRRGETDFYHRFENFEIIENALAQGKGCILIHPHFGAVQFPFFHLGFKGYKIMQVGELLKPPNLTKLGEKAYNIRKELEDALPMKIISPRHFLRPLFDHLKEGGLIMMPGDGSGGERFYGKFITIDFLNQKMKFPIGPVSLALKTGTPIVPLFTIIDEHKKYKTIVESPMKLIHCEDRDEEIKINIQQFANLFEKYIVKYPQMWLLWDEFQPGFLLEE